MANGADTCAGQSASGSNYGTGSGWSSGKTWFEQKYDAAKAYVQNAVKTVKSLFSPSNTTPSPTAASNSGKLPTLEIDSEKMPNIADNVRTAQANGKPNILTRTTDQARIDANRAAACNGYCGAGSPDEYPFASTYEGGAGAQVRGVPISEQRIQGGTLSRFYLNNHIGDGGKFKVIVR